MQHVVDDVLDLVDELALDDLGELDLANQLRGLDLRAHHLPARAAVLPLVLARDELELLVELLDDEPRLADGLDLAEELLRPLFDAVVGDLLVVEDDQLADRAVAGAERIAHADDRLGDGRHARDRLDDRQLALLDALGDGDFALAREQRHGAHLAQVHADGIVRLVERARREVELRTFAFFALHPVALAVRLLGIDEVDAGGAEGGEQLFEVLRGRREIGRQQIADLVVEQVALLLADDDELTYFVELVFDRQGRVFLHHMFET